MFEVFLEWFGQGFSLPVIATDLFFAAIGVYAAMKISSKKTVIYIMLTMIVLYIAACFVAECSIVMFAVYSVLVGGAATLIFAGAAIGLLIRAVKK